MALGEGDMVKSSGPANLNSRKSKLWLLILFLITGYENQATFPLRTFDNFRLLRYNYHTVRYTHLWCN